MIDNVHPLPLAQQCRLLDIARSTAYYRNARDSTEDLALMRLIDEIHLKYPFYGTRRIRDRLEDLGHWVNRKRVQRLMRRMGLVALYPKKRTSIPGMVWDTRSIRTSCETSWLIDQGRCTLRT